MNRFILLRALIFLFLLFLAACHRGNAVKWIVYYGEALKGGDLKGVALAILDPNAISPSSFQHSKTAFIGYVSIGEAEPHRYYWPLVSEAKFLAGKNPGG